MKFCPKCGARLKLAKARRDRFSFRPAVVPTAAVAAPMMVCPGCGAQFDQLGRDGDDKVPMAQAKRASLLQSFPHQGMRPFQKEILEKMEAALTSGKKFIILEAPVGFGKSAVAAALCKYLGSAYILTSTKQLQAQYSADFNFTTVMGKSNFTCHVPTSSGRLVACSKGRCEADWKLSDCPHYLSFEQYQEHIRGLCSRDSKCEKLRRVGNGKVCSYYQQKWDSFREEVTVGNYPFFLSELKFTEDLTKRKLLVCDEAHDLERQLVSFSSFTLKASSIRQYQTEDSSSSSSSSGRETPFSIPYEERMASQAGEWSRALGDARDTLRDFFESHTYDLSMQDRLTSCREMLESLEGFTKQLKSAPENWIVSGVKKTTAFDAQGAVVERVEEVVFQPLDVSAYTSQLFDTAETVLLMSATVFSEALLCRTLGIPEELTTFIKVANSAFPVENRKIYAMDIVQLNRATLDASLESIAKAVDAIMDRHASERGIIHTTSYYQANYIMEHVSERNKARLVTTERSGARSELLRTHGATDASVLISPSLYQGVDLKDDLARFQVIVKVPYSDLSDRRTQVKMQRDKGWYDWQTALRLVQTYGRSVRSETDRAVTYVLDSNFPSFVRGHRDLFPAYFLEALSEQAP
jgi:ATP-dependent DNA helicase DinG